jgi:carbon monoxide dehydrogenase subunit G
MQFQHAIEIDAPTQVVWDFLWDVDQLAKCIPGCTGASVVEPHKRYSAVVTDRVGPIKLKMPLDLVVKESTELERLHVECNGKDPALGSSVKVDIVAELAANGAGTSLALNVNADVRGKIAGLGFGLFKRKFDDIMDQFSKQVKQAIEASQSTASLG